MCPDTADNSADPVLNPVEQGHRRDMPIACRTAPGRYRSDIRLRGERGTVFLDVRHRCRGSRKARNHMNFRHHPAEAPA